MRLLDGAPDDGRAFDPEGVDEILLGGAGIP
jgi:hypothetical protein